MRDLSIRGAGNILGAEQHGHIATVGFELYSQMLKEAVAELQGKTQQETIPDPQIELNVDAYLPSEYIRDEKQKIELYKKIRAVTTLEEVKDLEEEIEDRFGDLPEPVESLIKVARIRAYARKYGVETIEQKGTDITLKLYPEQNEKIDGQKLFQVAQAFPGKIRLSSGQRVGITFKTKGMSSRSALEMVEQFLIKYETVPNQKGAVKNATME
jgi:transcription-repair coupling factor (superfamily II helicase)